MKNHFDNEKNFLHGFYGQLDVCWAALLVIH